MQAWAIPTPHIVLSATEDVYTSTPVLSATKDVHSIPSLQAAHPAPAADAASTSRRASAEAGPLTSPGSTPALAPPV